MLLNTELDLRKYSLTLFISFFSKLVLLKLIQMLGILKTLENIVWFSDFSGFAANFMDF